MDCTNCNNALPEEAAFCPQCGAKVLKQAPPIKPIDSYKEVNNADELHRALLGDFLKALRKRIIQDHRSNQVEEYLSAFYSTKFSKQFSTASQQLTNEILESNSDNTIVDVDKMTQQRIEDLLDYFIIHNCKTINTVRLPEAILKYQNARLDTIKISTIVEDFLDLENEEETIYKDFLKMPVDKLKNASQSFLFPPKDEKIWLISDQSMFGSCKEGFAITEYGMYWRAPMEEAARIRFDQIKDLEAQQDWLLINGQFFNVNPSVNLRMLYLLRKFKSLHS